MQTWTDGSGRLSLRLKYNDVQSGHHQGRCDSDIAEIESQPYIREQTDFWDDDLLTKFIKELGLEVRDRESNIKIVIFVACGDLQDDPPQTHMCNKCGNYNVKREQETLELENFVFTVLSCDECGATTYVTHDI